MNVTYGKNDNYNVELNEGGEIVITNPSGDENYLGQFYVNAEGKLTFVTYALTKEFRGVVVVNDEGYLVVNTE